MTEELKYTNWYEGLPLKGSRGKFGAKSTFADRMAYLCIYHDPNNASVSIGTIAEAIGIVVPVASMLLNLRNKERYRREKEEYQRLGHAKAYQEYVFDKHISRVRAILHGKQLPELPGQISLGGRNFIIAQIENGKWVGTDMKTSFTTEWHDTREGATDEAIQLATLLTQQNS